MYKRWENINLRGIDLNYSFNLFRFELNKTLRNYLFKFKSVEINTFNSYTY